MRLTWWEWEELTDHFKQRPDIWQSESAEDLVWTRYSGETPVMGVLATLHGRPDHHYRTYEVQPLPVSWDESVCASYLLELADRWSSYGVRQLVVQFLVDELQVEPGKALLASIAIHGFELSEEQIQAKRLSWPEDESQEYVRVRGGILYSRDYTDVYVALREYNYDRNKWTPGRIALPSLTGFGKWSIYEGVLKIVRKEHSTKHVDHRVPGVLEGDLGEGTEGVDSEQ